MPRKRRASPAPGKNASRDSQRSVLGVGRRDFLKLAGISASAAGITGLPGCGILVTGEGSSVDALRPDFAVNLIRKTDFIILRFEFVGLRLHHSGTKVVPFGNQQGLIIVKYPSQHIVEGAIDQEDPPPGILKPAFATVSGPSRLVFKVPSDVVEIELSIEKLLEACSSYEMNVSPNALPPDLLDSSNLTLFQQLASSLADVSNLFSSGSKPSSADTLQSIRNSRGVRQLEQSSGLALRALPPSLAKQAARVINTRPTIPVEPQADETSLELPFRLQLSPSTLGGWAHSIEPYASPSHRVELWHTRLGVRSENGGSFTVDESPSSAAFRTVRAVWTRELSRDPTYLTTKICSNAPEDPPLSPQLHLHPALRSKDRIDLVQQTSNYADVNCKTSRPSLLRPKPVDVNLLMLSGLGGWLDVHGDWGRFPTHGLESWDHRAAMGRDNYVKIVRSGVAFPFGHSISKVTITERKLIGDNHTAFLWQRTFLVVREPIRTYPHGLRQFPFSQIHIKTLVTPDLEIPETTGPFRAKLPDGELYHLPAEALDAAGNVRNIDLAFVWTPTESGSPTAADVTTASNLYQSIASADLNGQRIAFARSKKIDDTTFEAESIRFDDINNAGDSTKLGVGAPPFDDRGFWPVMKTAKIQIEAVRHLSGQELATEFEYDSNTYLTQGFGGTNTGDVFLKASGSPAQLNFARKSDSSGGFVAPSLNITGLSRRIGPLGGDVDQAATTGGMDPKTFFDSPNAKIFGVFSLADLIKDTKLGDAPKFITQALDVIESLFADAERLQAKIVAAGTSPLLKTVSDAADALATDVGDLDPSKPDLLPGVIDKIVSDIVDLKTAVQAVPDSYVLGPPAPTGRQRDVTMALSRMRNLLDDLVPKPSNTDSIRSTLEKFASGAELAKNLTVHLDWRPTIGSFPGVNPIFVPATTDGLLLSVEARAKAQAGKPAGVDLLASLENFDLNLIAPATFLTLHFDLLEFSVESGKKPDVNVVFGDMGFDGVLHFVDALRQIIPLDGFSDPPALDVTSEGITASFDLALPNLALGMFALQNLSLGAGFTIPFVGNPLTVSFNFCTKENPCNLTVTFLGGGMWFCITLDPNGVELLEAGFEFGASLSIDFGVASGSVSIMAGIYFRMEEDDAQLSGYLRMRGSINAAGIAGASIELYMELSYEFSSKKVTGRASVTIEVHVLMFSGSVTITAERKFSGSNDDPTFEDVMKPAPLDDGDTTSPWSQYLGAFALAA